MEIGEKIRRIRIERGLTQEELADRAELSKGFISQIERDLTSPSIATLEDILTCLGTDCGEFFTNRTRPQVLGGRLFCKGGFGPKEPHRMDRPQRPAKRDGTHPADPGEGGIHHTGQSPRGRGVRIRYFRKCGSPHREREVCRGRRRELLSLPGRRTLHQLTGGSRADLGEHTPKLLKK